MRANQRHPRNGAAQEQVVLWWWWVGVEEEEESVVGGKQVPAHAYKKPLCRELAPMGWPATRW